VIEGSRSICAEAGISLAGGHSIDSPEPIFGLAVNGIIPTDAVKQNNTAVVGNELFLTKALGVGILTTAEKKGILKPEHAALAAAQMMQLNKVGEALGKIKGVKAMTDVTGFGLLGHLIEMAEGSGTSAKVQVNKLPLITPELLAYIEQKAVPGGTLRNWASYGQKIDMEGFGEVEKSILADPQTSGGLLIAVDPASRDEVLETLKAYGLGDFTQPIGEIISKEKAVIRLI
jgi:selenide,water dikinase